MEPAATLFTVQKVLREFLPNLGPTDLPLDLDLFKMGLDSMNALVFLMRLEEEFKITISVDEVTPEHFSTPRLILAFLQRKLQGDGVTGQ